VKRFNGSEWIDIGQPGFSTDEVWFISLQFAGGVPYVFYSDKAADKKASVKKFNGIDWVDVGKPGFSMGTAEFTSLFINGNDIYVAYLDYGNFRKAAVMKYVGLPAAYDGNGSTGGSVPTGPVNYKDGASVSVLGNTGNLSRTGYTYAGWNTAADGSGTPYSAGDTFTLGASDVTLYAQWKIVPLPAPTSVIATAGDEQVTLQWDTVSGAVHYNIYTGTVSGHYDDSLTMTVTGSTYNVTGLTNGTTYYFAVTAANTVTESVYSDEVFATPKKTVYPTLTSVRIESDNPASHLAKAGDTVSLTIAADMALNGLPTVVIGGEAAIVASAGGNLYIASRTMKGSDSEGEIAFAIDYVSFEGVPGEKVTATTDGSQVIIDMTAPTGNLTINGGAVLTNSTSVVLTITSSDGAGVGNIQMRFSNDNADWSAWEPAAGTKSWTLAAGNGTKTVYMELMDAAGNKSASAITGSIELHVPSSGNAGNGRRRCKQKRFSSL